MRSFVLFMAVGMLVVGVSPAFATNGMNLEGYGPVATAMGGASFAFDNGTAATMNNPATLALMAEGIRLDLAIGMLGPNVNAIVTTQSGDMTAESEATAFYMPAIGVAYKDGPYLFGLGVYGQGGMGTEFANTSWMADPSMGANTALTEGLVNRTEVSIGRAIAPFAYDVNEKLSVGVTADLVWAGIDIQMALSEAQFQDLTNPQAQTLGTASGTLVDAFGMMYEPFGGTGISKVHHAYFDFSNDSDFTGQAMGYGFAGKIGATYEATPELTIGAAYHSKTALSDLETTEAELSIAVNVDPGIFQGQPTGTYSDMNIPVTGEITIADFEWPSMFGIGAAYKPMDKLMLALDVRYIMWSGVMEDFTMAFKADDTTENGGFAGLEMEAVLFQDWDDQAVFSFGGEYRAVEPLALRAGVNISPNPVPDDLLNALFPAIVENHVTFGAGYDINQASHLNASFTLGLESEQSNPGNGSTIPEVASTHSQLNWMLMYSHYF